MHAAQQPPFATTAIIYVIVIALFVWRMARPQRMSVLRLWIMPVFLLAITGFSIYANIYAAALAGEAPPADWQIAAVLALGAILGIPLGFLRGRHSEVKPTERPGVMYVHSSPVIILIWLAAFIARAVLRAVLPHAHAGTALGGDGLMAFAMAALITSYYAIYKKYRSAVQQARAA
jgi:CcdC-like protein